MAELDELLRDSFARISEQTTTPARDSAGVAEAIRARVAAGDTGAPAAGSTAPGWGGIGLGGVLGAIGLVVVAGVAGASLGLAGVFGHPLVEQPTVADAALATTASAHRCVGGDVIGQVAADTRVLAVARSDDASWIGVRNPSTLTGTLWFPAAVVAGDSGTDWEALPVGGACPTTVVAPLHPTESPAPTEEP
ncbi:hypothetical protein FJ656_18695, partial [Schumannella luteola]